jgi:hypothetical protein
LVRLKRNLPLPSGGIKRLPLARKASAQNHQHAAVAFPLLCYGALRNWLTVAQFPESKNKLPLRRRLRCGRS